MLITVDQGNRKIAINPDEVAQVVPMTSPGWTLITMRNRIEHAVVGEWTDLMRRINLACAEGTAHKQRKGK